MISKFALCGKQLTSFLVFLKITRNIFFPHTCLYRASCVLHVLSAFCPHQSCHLISHCGAHQWVPCPTSFRQQELGIALWRTTSPQTERRIRGNVFCRARAELRGHLMICGSQEEAADWGYEKKITKEERAHKSVSDCIWHELTKTMLPFRCWHSLTGLLWRAVWVAFGRQLQTQILASL